MSRGIKYLLYIFLPALLAGCAEEVNNDRLPAMPVDINLANPGLWAAYGVSGVNTYRYFIRDAGEPAGFYYLDKTYTGFGGVLLYGMGTDTGFGDVHQAWPYYPAAFDLACPVEVDPNVLVAVDDARMEAVCQECGSRYSLEAYGAPISGPALDMKYGLQRYKCMGDPTNGFHIIR